MIAKGKRPSRPADASKLGLSSGAWKVIEDCWNKKRDKRPEIQNVASRLRKHWWVDFNLSLRLLPHCTPELSIRSSDPIEFIAPPEWDVRLIQT